MVNISDAALKWMATNILVKKWFDHWVQWIQYEYWGCINLYHHPCTWPLRQQVCSLCAWLQVSHDIPGESESYLLSLFRIWTTYSHSLSILKSNNFKLKMIQGWQTLCGLLLYKILTVTGKSNFKVTCRKQIREVLAAWQPSLTYNLWRWPPSTGPPWFHFFLASSSSPVHLSPAQRPWLGYATSPSIIFPSSSWRSNPLASDTDTCVRERLELCPSRGLPDRQDLSCWCTGGSSNILQ